MHVKKIDIVMVTKNSQEVPLYNCLKSLLRESSKSEIRPRLIVIDGGSKNNTINIIKKFRSLKPTIFYDIDGNRATARQIGIKKVETDLFVFLDDDVVLSENWFTDILKYFDDSNIGAVWGGAIPQGKMLRYYEAMTRLYRTDVKKLVLSNGKVRGLTHDTIIRTDLVKDIEIPEDLHVMEDHYIRLHIESKGYRWIPTLEPFCYHYKKYNKRPSSRASLDAFYGWKLNVYRKSKVLKHLFFFPIKIFYILMSTRDMSLVEYESFKEYFFLKGFYNAMRDDLF
jgi:glycosyltransferase involved in cell wall biosynthesis